MTQLPNAIRSAPKAFYVIAVVWVIWRVLLPFVQLNATGFADGLTGDTSIAKFVLLERAGRAIFDAAFLAAAGVNAQLLIFICDRMRGSAPVQDSAE